MKTHQRKPLSRGARWAIWLVVIAIVYIASSGPMIGLGFWLRESTGVDAFYAVMALYYPILAMGHESPFVAYVEWWVIEVFHTVGPG